MGDRGNIIVKDGSGTVYLYTHWHGSELLGITQAGLRLARTDSNQNGRLDDGPYLARILFCTMLMEGAAEGQVSPAAVVRKMYETGGFGISSVPGDGLNYTVTVDVEAQTVEHAGKIWTFAEFMRVRDIAADDAG